MVAIYGGYLTRNLKCKQSISAYFTAEIYYVLSEDIFS